MMQTHKILFYWIFGFTVLTLLGYCYFEDGSMANEICLALFGSGAIASILELVNYSTSKRELIMQIIADNVFISNCISDTVWLYRTTIDYKQKLDIFLELYEKSQSYIFTLSKDVYAPFYKKDQLRSIVKENADAMVEIWDVLLEGQRQIALFRASRKYLIFENEEKKEQGIYFLDKQLVELTNDFIIPLKKYESTILNCTQKYREAYKLLGVASVENQDDIMKKIEKRIDASKSNGNVSE